MSNDVPPVELPGAQGAQMSLSGGGTQINNFLSPAGRPLPEPR
jgi:hypothetical protein